MIIYIKTDNEFELWDMMKLNREHIETNWTTIELPTAIKKKNEEIETLQLEIKTEDEDDKYDKRKKYDKLFDTLKLAIKLGVVK